MFFCYFLGNVKKGLYLGSDYTITNYARVLLGYWIKELICGWESRITNFLQCKEGNEKQLRKVITLTSEPIFHIMCE